MFELEKFIEDCGKAVKEKDSHTAVRELVAEAVSDPARLMAVLGEPNRGGVHRLHVAEDLTVLNIVWAPRMTLKPHNHNMWAVIGLYTGREDNIFWRKVKDATDGQIEAAGAKSLGVKEVAPLGKDIVHSVTNPLSRCTGALHVYGGNFFETPRSEWNPETLCEGPYDVARNMALFEEANRFFDAA
jgi:predicted metal-dependent enzyme (double-stranded beta helix superfamily)